MYQLHEEGHLLSAGSPPQYPGEASVSPMGIVHGHAYAILRLVKVRDIHGEHKLVQLRNPWGRPRGDVEWRGDWSDIDTVNWTTRMKRKVNFIAREDGIFWMSFEDFCEHFHSLYICRLYIRDLELPTNRIEKGWRKYTCPGTWIQGSTGGGAPTRTHKRAGLNPQYLLLPTMPHTSIFITLEQPSLYMAKHVCIFVSSVGGRRFQRIRGRVRVELFLLHTSKILFYADFYL